MQFREKEKLCFPDKVFEKTKKFKLNTCFGNFLSKTVGQENDKYDEIMLRYMFKQERGEQKPKMLSNGETIVKAKSSLFIENTKGVWKPNDFLPNLLTVTKPLLDRTNTPRGAKRAITCERNLSHAKWLYNKKTLDDFNPDYSKKDILRSKNLRKIQKK